jgi:serine/threonine protein kinase
MTSDPKRETVLPHQLHGFLAEGDGIHVEQPRLQTKSPEGNPAYHLGVPTGPSKFEKRSDHPKLSSPSRYHKSYLIDQAGSGVIALKDTEKLPICLIKCCQPQKRSSLKLQFASHKNLVSLIDHFHSDNEVQLIYEYEHLAISLGCVAGTVSFSEADIATICKEVLDGLKYVHTVLRITYGLLDFSNILITWQGEVKLGTVCSLRLYLKHS